MSQQWYVFRSKKKLGPYTSKELVEASRTGELLPSHELQRVGTDGRIPAGRLRGLAFKGNETDRKLLEAYLQVAKKVSRAISCMEAEQARAAGLDVAIVDALESDDLDALNVGILLTLGHDLLYWAILAILADGEVQQDELTCVGPLIKNIGRLFAKHLPAYKQFADMVEADCEQFLGVFKKDKKHYPWPSKGRADEISSEVLVGAQAVVAASVQVPSSTALVKYGQVVTALVDAVVLADGLTAEEKALQGRVKKLLDDLKVTGQKELPTPVSDSPLLSGTVPTPKPPPKRGHFRRVTWGMSRAEVVAAEDTEPVEETEKGIFFNGSVAGLDALVVYVFASELCVRAKYAVDATHSQLNRHINDYQTIRDLLVTKYGPAKGKPTSADDMFWLDDLYRDQYSDWGFAISLGHLNYSASWHSDDTDIFLVLTGNNYQITLAVEYCSKELSRLEDEADTRQHLDDL